MLWVIKGLKGEGKKMYWRNKSGARRSAWVKDIGRAMRFPDSVKEIREKETPPDEYKWVKFVIEKGE